MFNVVLKKVTSEQVNIWIQNFKRRVYVLDLHMNKPFRRIDGNEQNKKIYVNTKKRK